MTTAQSTVLWASNTAANAAAWVNSISSLYTSIGMTRNTTVTGQIDTANLSSMSGGNATLGFQIWEFPDNASYAVDKRIYIRQDYGMDSGGRMAPHITVANSVGSAGVMPANNVTNEMGSGFSAGYENTTMTSYACYKNGTLSLVLGHSPFSTTTQPNNATSVMLIDRSRDATGAPTSLGFLAEWMQSGTAAPYSRSMWGNTSPSASSPFIPSLIPNMQAASSAAGNNVNVFRHYMMVPGVVPAVGMLSYFHTEFSPLSPLTATVLGTARTYLPMGHAMTNWTASSGQVTGINVCGAILWE